MNWLYYVKQNSRWLFLVSKLQLFDLKLRRTYRMFSISIDTLSSDQRRGVENINSDTLLQENMIDDTIISTLGLLGS